MQYLILALEGVITFVSPCLLPMLPIYISYFAGGGERSGKKTMLCACGFVLGFTLLFTAMGALAGTLGSFLTRYQTALNIVCGLIVIFFGLHHMGLIRINLFSGGREADVKDLGFFSSMVFGIVFSVSWTPCVGAFLGSALMMASQQGEVLTGVLMLLCYSLGLGVPFLLSALLLDQLRGAFNWIKRHYRVVNLVCGGFLVLIGVLMATGLLGKFLVILG